MPKEVDARFVSSGPGPLQWPLRRVRNSRNALLPQRSSRTSAEAGTLTARTFQNAKCDVLDDAFARGRPARGHHDAVQRLTEVPGLGVDSAQQIIAEVGATAATFPSPQHLASWMGACPGNEESAGVNYSHRCPKGNRQMRRVLNQAANAAVKAKGTIFAIVYRRLVPRLGHAQAIGAIAHRLCRLIWKILHEGIRYEERGPAVSVEAKNVRTRKMVRELRTLGYRVELLPAPSSSPA